MKDQIHKHIYKSIAPTLPDDRGRNILGRLIGYKDTHLGLGGIFVFPHRRGKHVYVINPANPLNLMFLHIIDDKPKVQMIITRRVRRVYR